MLKTRSRICSPAQNGNRGGAVAEANDCAIGHVQEPQQHHTRHER